MINHLGCEVVTRASCWASNQPFRLRGLVVSASHEGKPTPCAARAREGSLVVTVHRGHMSGLV